MDTFFDKIVANLTSINFQGPAAFVLALLALFAFLKKYSLVLLIILTVVLAWGAQDIILISMSTDEDIVTLPFIIYSVGGVIIFIVAIFSFFKSP